MTPRRSLIPLFAALLLAAGGGVCAQTILMVTNTNSLSSEESLRRTQFENWGYTVTTVRDSDSQATYDTAMASADVVYVSEEVGANSVAYKLREATIGVINEERYLDVEFGFATSDGYESTATNQIVVTDNSHPVSADLATGYITIFSSTQPRVIAQGTLAGGFQELATAASGELVLGVIETDGALANTYNGNSTASGRRVRLPFGGGAFSFSSLDSDGLSILENALAWASSGGGSTFIGHWKLDETNGTTASDSRGSNDGVVVGGGNWLAAPRGNGLSLDSSSYINVPADTSLDVSGDVTIAFWFKLDASFDGSEASQVLAEKFTSNSQNFYVALAGDDYSNGSVPAGSLVLKINSASGNYRYKWTNTTTWDADTWHHVVAILDADDSANNRIYIDAADDTAAATVGAGSPGGMAFSADLNFGGKSSEELSGDRFLAGSIDDIYFYNQEISESRIAEIYGLVGHWKLDEASGSTAFDSSLNANDGAHESGVTEGQAGPLSGTLAAEYDGSNNQTEIVYGGDWNAVDDCFSLVAWARIDTASDHHGLIVWSDTASPYALLVNDDDEVEVRANWGSVSGESGNITHSSAGVLTPGVWSHVAVTYDGGAVRFYIGGVEDPSTLSTSVTMGVSNDEMHLGGDDGSSFDLTGALYDARVYNRRLLPEEIADLAGGSTSTGLRITSWVETANP